ncbi:formylglycine-generating enzyme family protein [Lignipirellula cremea]|uniref:Formylglycine-generating sulfatase enzyme n=1 Tax=Lignipirellula cremea TaxID=2528010 RepID=A0A518E0P6_9BACT|nr:formylglycine-generating enzyme family protein [Lignipirellula cremea]QDU97665.1 Formylglycine-generating sulfatase enzyme [Lignipirellula cremea]
MIRKLLVCCLLLAFAGCAESAPAPQGGKYPTSRIEAGTPVWDGWPADGPPPAMVPFNADEAETHRQEWAAFLDLPVEPELKLAEDVRLKLRFIPPGQFLMGSTGSESFKEPHGGPVVVTISEGFYLGETEVTQAQWTAVMGTEPWSDDANIRQDPACAASCLCWADAVAFCEKLTRQEHAAGRLAEGWRYTLPTEAQWEYACRAGTLSTFYFGEDAGQLVDYAWFNRNTWYDDGPVAQPEEYAHAVGQKKPNAWGLYDMYGNVWEWNRDWQIGQLPGGIDPLVVTMGTHRSARGGSWDRGDKCCYSAFRFWISPEYGLSFTGFRVASVPSGQVEEEPVTAEREDASESP